MHPHACIPHASSLCSVLMVHRTCQAHGSQCDKHNNLLISHCLHCLHCLLYLSRLLPCSMCPHRCCTARGCKTTRPTTPRCRPLWMSYTSPSLCSALRQALMTTGEGLHKYHHRSIVVAYKMIMITIILLAKHAVCTGMLLGATHGLHHVRLLFG